MVPGPPQASLIVFRNPGSFRTSTRETCVQRVAERRAAFLSGHAGRGSPVPRCPCLPAPSEPRLPMVGDVGRVGSRVGFRAWGLFLTPRYLSAPKEEPPCLPRLAGHAPRHRAGRACSSTSQCLSRAPLNCRRPCTPPARSPSRATPHGALAGAPAAHLPPRPWHLVNCMFSFPGGDRFLTAQQKVLCVVVVVVVF